MKTSSLFLIVTVGIALSFCAVCAGKTITVNVAGGADFTSIQAAISDANTLGGDEIEVAPGTYYEAIDFLGKAVRLYSSGGAEITTIDGTGHYHVVQCVSSEGPATILEGFTVTGGDANDVSSPGNLGGGMYNSDSSPTVIDCIFSGNYAYWGGGMYNVNSSPAVTDCIFTGNTASDGSGMYNFNYSNPAITNCIFSGNTASYSGGGMINYNTSKPTVTNCIFSDNTSGFYGGGMTNINYSQPTVTNCTFSGNTANWYGGGMYNSDSNPIVVNSILWGNSSEIYNTGSSAPVVTYCDVQGGYTGTGNINADPNFVDAAAGNLRLTIGSLCVDSGDNGSVPAGITTDLAGLPRIMDGDDDTVTTVDMGVYEFFTRVVKNVTKDKFYQSIQAAINEADDGDQIEVSPGTYTESIDFLGKAVRLYSNGGAEVTTINGTGYYHVVQCVNGEGTDTILDGFTITGGFAVGTVLIDQMGGGMYNGAGSSPTVTHCIFSGNLAIQGGGGIGNYDSNPTITNCIFSGNLATNGGGIYNIDSSPTVTNCTFGNNRAYDNGGGIYNSSSTLTVTDCTFNNNTADNDGGGLYNIGGGSPTVTNCIFSGNTAFNGGGIYNNNSNSTITYCTFSENICDNYGGGIYNESSNSATTHCTFSINTANSGGGIYNFVGSPAVTHCTFSNNTANDGGGMCNESGSPTVGNCLFGANTASIGGGMSNINNTATVTNCTFNNNSVTEAGGGMRNYDSTPTIINGSFNGNTAQLNGGGMYNTDSSPTVRSCIFSSNSTNNLGGGIYNDNSSPTVTNCTLDGNTASYGGGMYNYLNSNPSVTNCTFSRNSAVEIGGGMYSYNSPVVANCIFWGNTASTGAQISGGSSTVSYSDIQGGFTGTGNINADPCFVDAAASDLRLLSGSPCIDKGYNYKVPAGITTDLAGLPRIMDGDENTIETVDMGAYEFFLPIIRNVTTNQFYPTIQTAINYANSGDRIEVAPGTYYETINFNGKAVHLYSSGGPDVTIINGTSGLITSLSDNFNDGNFTGWQKVDQGDTDTSSWSAATGTLVQSGNMYDAPIANNPKMLGTYVYWTGDSSWTDYEVTLSMKSTDNDAMGVMFRYQNTDTYYRFGWYNEDLNQGVDNMSLVRFEMNNLDILAQKDKAYEVGREYQILIRAIGSNLQVYIDGVLELSVSDSILGPDTIALYCWGNAGTYFDNVEVKRPAYHVVQCTSGEGPNTILEGFTITGGEADGAAPNYIGAGMYNSASSPTVKNCRFTGNTAQYSGGGMGNDNSSPTVTNCTFGGNSSTFDGGGIYNYYSSPTVTDCLFTGNSASYYGAGMYNENSSPTVTNCTFSGNSAYYGGGIYNDNSSPTVTNCIVWNNEYDQIHTDSGSPLVTYCDVQGGYTGNIDADPNFLNAAAGDFRLAAGSPCIDAGDNAAVLAGIFKDLAGKYRFADDPLITDTGAAGMTGRPVVDMGAYEYQGPATTPQNLLANGGFEAGDARGWITNWGFTLEANTTQIHNGNYSGLAGNRSAPWQGAWQSVMGLMDDDKTYRISGWVRLQNADSNDIALTVKKTDDSGTHYYPIDNTTAYDDQWVLLNGTVAMDIVGEVTELFIYFEGPAAGINFYVDDASVTEVKSDMSHDGRVDLSDFSMLAAVYGFDCLTQDCGRANLDDYDNTIDTFDLAVLIADWFVGVQ